MKDVGDLLRTRGKSADWDFSFPSQTAYKMALSRLKKSGMTVQKPDRSTGLPVLCLTEKALKRLPDYCYPEEFWNRKWNGIWYTLIFDVPESERRYRDILRSFLKKQRMGCLQKSVWVTPQDIRPLYDDLKQTANVHAIAYLLESRTVLHRDSEDIVTSAWDFDRLEPLHERYLTVFTQNYDLIKHARPDRESLYQLHRVEAEAYIQCLQFDPLLPKVLHPAAYQGMDVFKLHRKIRIRIAEALLEC